LPKFALALSADTTIVVFFPDLWIAI